MLVVVRQLRCSHFCDIDTVRAPAKGGKKGGKTKKRSGKNANLNHRRVSAKRTADGEPSEQDNGRVKRFKGGKASKSTNHKPSQLFPVSPTSSEHGSRSSSHFDAVFSFVDEFVEYGTEYDQNTLDQVAQGSSQRWR